MAGLITARALLKTENILTHSPDVHLSQAISNLQSSHDAAFVVDEGVLIGAVNPYYTLFRSHYPPTTKLKHCCFMPPKLSLNDDFTTIARQMLQSKLYFLPVCEADNKLLGIVSIRRLLRAVLTDKDLIADLTTFLKPRSIKMTVTPDTSVDQARRYLSKSGVSRLPVVNSQGKLVGVVTRFDIRRTLTSPQTSVSAWSRSGEKRRALAVPVGNFMTRMVVAAPQESDPGKLIREMLIREIGSIMLIDRVGKPVGVLTYRDILQAIYQLYGGVDYSVVTTYKKDFQDTALFEGLLQEKLTKVTKRVSIRTVEVTLDYRTTPAQTIKDYTVRLRLTLTHGQAFHVVVSDKDWRLALDRAVEKLERQVVKSLS